MPKCIGWGITSAGYFLRETFSVMYRAVKEKDLKVTTFLSSAGAGVVRIYGLSDKLKEISSGGYFQEVLEEESEGPVPSWSLLLAPTRLLRLCTE